MHQDNVYIELTICLFSFARVHPDPLDPPAPVETTDLL